MQSTLYFQGISSLLNTASIYTKMNAIIVGQEVYLEFFVYVNECLKETDMSMILF